MFGAKVLNVEISKVGQSSKFLLHLGIQFQKSLSDHFNLISNCSVSSFISGSLGSDFILDGLDFVRVTLCSSDLRSFNLSVGLLL